MPSHLFLSLSFLYQNQSGYGRRSRPPSPISSVTVIKLAGTPFSLTEVTNNLPSTRSFVNDTCVLLQNLFIANRCHAISLQSI